MSILSVVAQKVYAGLLLGFAMPIDPKSPNMNVIVVKGLYAEVDGVVLPLATRCAYTLCTSVLLVRPRLDFDHYTLTLSKARKKLHLTQRLVML